MTDQQIDKMAEVVSNLQEQDLVLRQMGFAEWSYMRLAISEAIKLFAALRSQPGARWVKAEDKLPTAEDVFDGYSEVLTIQVGRQRPTMMKFWEVKDCPFTKMWMRLPAFPTPI